MEVARRRFRVDVAVAVGAETVALVGPSGSGKSTVLRAVAGLERPDAGRIALGDRVWFDADRRLHLPPERRSVGMVFQDHVLFPHMDVTGNVAFGAGRTAVPALLDRLGIAHLAHARPAELSGGERQRVALARALARAPGVLLLDEPLSALDAHTRIGVRGELRSLLGALGLPTIVVSHDMEDAAALADRVVVLDRGRPVQVGSPADLVTRPVNAFVAALTGSNLLPGRVAGRRGGLTEVVLDRGDVVRSPDPARGRVGVVVQPADIGLDPGDAAGNRVRGAVTAATDLGAHLRVDMAGLRLEMPRERAPHPPPAAGTRVTAVFAVERTRLVPLDDAAPGLPGGAGGP